jgi:hypothetical protein
MTLAGVTLGAIVLLADFGIRSLLWGGGRRRSSGNRNGGAAMAVIMTSPLSAILAPILARLLYFACSRSANTWPTPRRRSSPAIPPARQRLRKIAMQQDPKQIPVNRVVAPMYAVNPLAAAGSASLFGTHRPLKSASAPDGDAGRRPRIPPDRLIGCRPARDNRDRAQPQPGGAPAGRPARPPYSFFVTTQVASPL